LVEPLPTGESLKKKSMGRHILKIIMDLERTTKINRHYPSKEMKENSFFSSPLFGYEFRSR